MHIKKQRLLTPGPTPLYPPALRAMMASDMHHRTEDFRNVYKSVLADLKEVMGTSATCCYSPHPAPAPWKHRFRTCSRVAIK